MQIYRILIFVGNAQNTISLAGGKLPRDSVWNFTTFKHRSLVTRCRMARKIPWRLDLNPRPPVPLTASLPSVLSHHINYALVVIVVFLVNY